MISGLALDIDDTLAHTGYQYFCAMREIFGDPWFPFEKFHHYCARSTDAWVSDEANRRILEKVHDNDYQKSISLVPWALETVWQIHRSHPFSCYVTMRPQDVLQWTQEWLAKHGFPQLPIVARPLSVSKENEHIWKVWTLNELYQEWVTGVIDDQVKIIHQMAEYYPDYQWVIHIIRPDTIIDSPMRHTISDSWEMLREKLHEEK